VSSKITDIGSINLGGKSFNIDTLLQESQSPEVEETPEQEEELIQEQEDAAAESLYSTPIEQWGQECEVIGLRTQEAAKILDRVMSTGFYEESYRISTRVFKLRTRTTIDADRLIEMLRELKPENNAILSHLISRINIASSLSYFGETTFPHTPPTDDNREILDTEWKQRWAFTSSMPQPIFLAVAQTLQNFDNKVGLACDARALENF